MILSFGILSKALHSPEIWVFQSFSPNLALLPNNLSPGLSGENDHVENDPVEWISGEYISGEYDLGEKKVRWIHFRWKKSGFY